MPATDFADDFLVGLDDADLGLNPALLELAKEALAEKAALVPPGGGAPPPDPAAAGGAPMPGGDPSMGAAPGGMPGQPMPADPSMAGQVPMPQQPMQPAGPAGGKGGKAQTDAKLDRLISEIYQLRKLTLSALKACGAPIPEDAILGPEPPAPPQDPTNMAASPAAAGAAAMVAPAPAPGGMPGAAPGGMPPMGGDPSAAAKAAALAARDDADTDAADAAAEAFLRMLNADDGGAPAKAASDADEIADFFLGFAPGGKAAAAGEAPERVGTVYSSRDFGPLRRQPLLLAMAARRAAQRAGGR